MINNIFDNDNDNYLIILEEEMNVYELQKKLCFTIKNCYIYDNLIFNNSDNIAYINYNDKIYMIIKQSSKRFYIKYVNII
jgi:hypothetical protein